jgi:hypothetical protein
MQGRKVETKVEAGHIVNGSSYTDSRSRDLEGTRDQGRSQVKRKDWVAAASVSEEATET